MIPEWAKYELDAYVERGKPVGGFLESVLSNDLMGAFERADDFNRGIMLVYCRYLYNKMPSGSWGSKKLYEDWIALGGQKGQRKSNV